MADNEPEACGTCGGDGTVEEDRFTPGRGHYTRAVTCHDCDGTGLVGGEGPIHDPAEAELDRPPPTEDRSGLKDSPL